MQLATQHQNIVFLMLDMSTGHLSTSTRNLLTDGLLEGALYYPKGPWGWFVHVPNKDDGLEVNAELPADIKLCLTYAQALKKDWVIFDVDGQTIPDLPVHEDEADPAVKPLTGLEDLAQAYCRHLHTKHNEQFFGTVTKEGKLAIRSKGPNGMNVLITAEFAQAMLYKQLPVRDIMTAPVPSTAEIAQ